MDSEVINHDEIDFANCHDFFLEVTQKLRKLGNEKLIVSRIKMIQTLSFFLKEAIKRLQPDKVQRRNAL